MLAGDVVIRYRAGGRAAEWSERISQLLKNWGARVHLESSEVTAQETLACRASLLIIVGGDGTLLGAVRICGGSLPPVLGFSVDSLGYLLPHKVEAYEDVLERVSAGDYRIDELRLGSYSHPGGSGYFLNEVSLWAPRGKLIECRVRVGELELHDVRCDGIIISTSAGSTGHALSYGGPIILGQRAPVLELLVPGVLSPLVRPIVAYGRRVEVALLPSSRPAALISDGYFVAEVPGGAKLRVAPSRKVLRMLVVQEHSTEAEQKLLMRLTDMGRALPRGS